MQKRLKFLREHEVAQSFKEISHSQPKIMIAVPFWGKGGGKKLKINDARSARIICNLSSNGCNPYEIEVLKKKKNVNLKTHPRLHAKIYATQNACIIGSSNASSNGLIFDGENSNGTIEANILSDDVQIVSAATKLFNEMWDSKEAESVTDVMLSEAIVRWKNRPKPTAIVRATTLLAACRESPKTFDHVYVFGYRENLYKEGKKALAAVQKNSKPSQHIGASSFKSAWGYQIEKRFEPGSWILDLDCRRSGAKVHGCSRVPVPPLLLNCGTEEYPLTVTIRGIVEIDGKKYRISKDEKKQLIMNANAILKMKAEIPKLIDVIKLMDRKVKK